MATSKPKAKTKPKRRGNPNWVPGKSGNPKGRPLVSHRVVDLARAHTVTALNTLLEICTDPGANPSARVKAAEHILDRGHGRPKQSVDLEVSQVETLSREELIAEFGRIHQKLLEAGGGDSE